MAKTIAEQANEQIAGNWKSIAACFPSSTPAHVVEHLRVEYLTLVAEGVGAVFDGREGHTNGHHWISLKVRPHIREAFIRQAHSLRFMRDPASVVARQISRNDVKSVPRGIVAHRAKARRESVR